MNYNRDRHLSQEHWQDIADPKSLVTDETNAHIVRRRRILAAVMPILKEIIEKDLTLRQREVWTLYFSREIITQVKVAEILGISQPTVNQHLNGKLRRGKKVGGAVKRIRKYIQKRLLTSDINSPGMRTLAAFDSLLRQTQSRRKAYQDMESIHR